MKYFVMTGIPNMVYVGIDRKLETDDYGNMYCSLAEAELFRGKLPPYAFRPRLPEPKPAPKAELKPAPKAELKPAPKAKKKAAPAPKPKAVEKKSAPKKAAKPKKSDKK